MRTLTQVLNDHKDQEDWIGRTGILRLEPSLTSEMKHAFLISAKKVCPEFRVTDNIKPYLSPLCEYFLGIRNGYDIEKGLFLYGKFGVGKSTLFASYRQWLADWWPFSGNGFQVTSVEEIIEHYKKTGNIEKFLTNKEEYGYPSPKHLLINEFGKEIKDKIYGTDAGQIINSLMMMRYDIFQKYLKVTHVTSNYIPISNDGAISDRYVEMFNVIEIGGESLRK